MAGCKRLPGSVWQEWGCWLLHTLHSHPACPSQGAPASSWPACRGQSQKLTLKHNMGSSVYFLQSLYLVILWERRRISNEIKKKPQGHKALKNRETSQLNTRMLLSPNFTWEVCRLISGTFWEDWGLESASDLSWGTIVENSHPQGLGNSPTKVSALHIQCGISKTP